MKRFIRYSLYSFLLLLVVPFITNAQKNLEIRTTNLQIVDKKLEINYEILNNRKFERFNVSVEITDSNGNPLNAKTLYGDIGKKQKGGKGKVIYWDFTKDRESFDEEVNVFVEAEKIINNNIVNLGNALLKSVVLPGWGLTTIEKKPYWLMGVAGYGSLSASIMLRASSNSNYDKYKSTNDPDLSTTYFNQSQNQESLSNAFIYTAIGTWLVSGIWTIIKTNNFNKSLMANNNTTNFNLCSTFDPVTKTSGLLLQINF